MGIVGDDVKVTMRCMGVENIEALLARLCSNAREDLVVRVVREWGPRVDPAVRIEAIGALVQRGDGIFDDLSVDLAKTLTWSEEAEMCAAIPRIGTNLEAHLAGSKRKETLRMLVERTDLTSETIEKLSSSKHEEIKTKARAKLVEGLEERIALGKAAGVETMAEWSRRDPQYNEWLLENHGDMVDELEWRLDHYMPRFGLGDLGRGHLGKVLEQCTNLSDAQRRGVSTYLSELKADRATREVVARAWGRTNAREMFEYVRTNFLTETSGWSEAWGSYLKLLVAVGKNGIERSLGLEWADEPTLPVALENTYSRVHALKSRLLAGDVLEREVRNVLGGNGHVALDAGALCSNPNVDPREIEQLATMVDKRGVYGLYASNLPVRCRAEVMARHPEFVETIVLARRMSVRQNGEPAEMRAWFAPEVGVLYASIIEKTGGSPGSEKVYVRWANSVIEELGEEKERILAAVRVEHHLEGEVANEVARMMAESGARPETMVGLFERWNGTVKTMISAAGKL